MNDMLNKAVSKATQLPEDQQEAIARMILKMIESAKSGKSQESDAPSIGWWF